MHKVKSIKVDAAPQSTKDAELVRRVFVKSYGCQMNVYDSHRMADLAGREGYDETGSVEDADLVVLNTCHIRERAAEKIFSELGKIAPAQGRARAGRRARR